MKIISVIPARGGSKGIKNKNIVKINSKPLIYFSIKQSLKTKLIQRTIVSTDSKKIAKISRQCGAEVPFLRPKSISNDAAKDYSFFSHLIKWLKKNENYTPDLIVQLRPTQPFRSIKLLQKAIELMIKDKKADSLRSISIPERTPFKMWIKKGRYLKYFVNKKSFIKKEYFNMDRRKLPKVYWHDGIVDIVRSNTLKKYKNLTGKKIAYIFSNNDYLIDIDTEKDLKLLKIFLKKKLIKFDVN